MIVPQSFAKNAWTLGNKSKTIALFADELYLKDLSIKSFLLFLE